jgi:sporulation protein YlmC with PRC-barrel domain
MIIRTTATAAALLVAASLPLYAQTSGSTTSPPPAGSAAPTVNATALQPGQIRASEMMGAKVYDKQNKNVADVKDMVVDHDGKIAAVVLDVGSGKYVAVPMNELQVQMQDNKLRLSTNMTENQLKSAQAFDLKARNMSGTSTPPAKEKK